MTSSLQSAFVLHRRPYSDSSLLLEVITPQSGRQPLIAKGARGTKGRSALLQPFTPLWIDWRGRGEVATLTAAETRAPAFRFAGHRLYCGLYINELLARLLPRSEAMDELFEDYESVLSILPECELLEPVLRGFELRLLEHLGYGLLLTHTLDDHRPVEPDLWYEYRSYQGPTTVPCESVRAVRGGTLLAMARSDFSDPEVRRQSLHLMRRIIDHYLDHKPLKSRELFSRPR